MDSKFKSIRFHIEISNLRDLFGLARHLSSVELYKSLSELCAAIFPTLLENGFINELSLDEIAYIEDAFRSYALENIVRTVDQFELSIQNLMIPKRTVRNIIMDILAVVKEPMDMKKLIDFCNSIKNDSHPKKRTKHMRSSVIIFSSADDVERIRNCESEKKFFPSEKDDVRNCGPQMELSTNEKGDNRCVQMPNIFSKATFKLVDIEKEYPSLSDIQIATATSEVCGKQLA
ncbi:unnamed protein product [Onchocerca flexuosa]|uniref:BACK domain-containing protein n=1 Tax=Onchocerca flexuosa TaxID=387005 RepID=A0A183HEA7_9BILA|nr:unnamed protein product [Onchocerca flexuosa]